MRREVVTLRVDDALDIAGDIIQLGRIRHLPVLDADGHLVGIVSQRDLLRASVSSVLELGAQADREWLRKVPVRDVMVTPVMTNGPDEPLAEAVDRMVDGKLGCLPVVENRCLVGLLTETDCLRHLAERLRPRQ